MIIHVSTGHAGGVQQLIEHLVRIVFLDRHDVVRRLPIFRVIPRPLPLPIQKEVVERLDIGGVVAVAAMVVPPSSVEVFHRLQSA